MKEAFSKENDVVPDNRLVMVSDTDGTLFQVAGQSFNSKLFETLIEAKHKGAQVFICSAADGTQTSAILRIQLKKRGLAEDFFEILHEDLDPANQPIIPKDFLEHILRDLDIRRVDFVFEDQSVDYLPEGSYSQKINPTAFVFANRDESPLAPSL